MIISAVDLNTQQKRLGRQALFARVWFELHGPIDARPLPLGYDEREALKRGGLPHIVAWYACSLACRDYAVEEHPSFDDYACGVMASDYAPYFITKDEHLRKRFPPRPLTGLGRPWSGNRPHYMRKQWLPGDAAGLALPPSCRGGNGHVVAR